MEYYVDDTISGIPLGENDYMYIQSGGVADKTTVGDYASVYVENGGKAKNTIMQGCGGMVVYYRGVASGTTVESGSFHIQDGGKAEGLSVISSGYALVSSGGKANDVKVSSGGMFEIASGGTATKIDWTPGEGRVRVEYGASAKFVSKYSGVYYGESGALISHDTAPVSGMTVSRGGEMYVMPGGRGENLQVKESGSLIVSSGGVVNGAEICGGGSFEACVGCSATGIDLAGGARASLVLAPKTLVAGTWGGEDFELKDGIVSGFTVRNCRMDVLSGGTAEDLLVDESGELNISSGGKAVDSLVMRTDAVRVFSGGAADRIHITENGMVYVSSGGEANRAMVDFGGILVVSEGGVANDVDLSLNGRLDVEFDGVANRTKVYEGAVMNVNDGGIINDTDVAIGTLYLNRGEAAGRTTVTNGGTFTVNYSISLTGQLIFENGTHNKIESGAGFNFDISELAPGASVRINNLTRLSGWVNAEFSLTVSKSQANGTYILAQGLNYFNRTITVWDPVGMDEYTLAVGETVKIGKKMYTLNYDYDFRTLSLVIGSKGVLLTKAMMHIDDGGNDWLLDAKDNLLNREVTEFSIDSTTKEVLLDISDDVKYIDPKNKNYRGLVGFADAVDFRKIKLECAAKLSFTVTATDAAKFTVYRLDTVNKKGKETYSLKALQTVTLKWDKANERYAAETKSILFDPTEQYYIAMESTNAGKGGNAYYSVELTSPQNAFFDQGDNSDDWDDLADAGAGGGVDTGSITEPLTQPLDPDGYFICGDWAGYEDEIDYKQFKLLTSANLSFTVYASDSVKFTVWQLVGEPGSYSLKALRTLTLKKSKKDSEAVGTMKPVLLDTLKNGEVYYFSVESTNARKGGDAYYSVFVDGSSRFYAHGDIGWNNLLYDKEHKSWNPTIVEGSAQAVNQSATEILLDSDSVDFVDAQGETWKNFVGYNDEADFAKIHFDAAGTLSFTVTATDAAKFAIYVIENDKLKTVLSGTLKKGKKGIYSFSKKNMSVGAAGDYYVSMTSTNAKKGGWAYYNVAIDGFTPKDKSALTMPEPESAASLVMPETDVCAADGLKMNDELSAGLVDPADTLADVSAFAGSASDDIPVRQGSGLLA